MSPEFSIRLMDETYAKENATIQKVLHRPPSLLQYIAAFWQ